MKASVGSLPSGDQWHHEVKWDGMRLQVCIRTGRQMQVWSGSGRDLSTSFPELTPLGDEVPLDATIDGEAVVFNHDAPDFRRLQSRIHRRQPSQAEVNTNPVVFVAFDILRLDGRLLLDLEYVERRQLLSQVITDGPNWLCPVAAVGEDAGRKLLRFAQERSLEGVVSKRITSRYQPGMRAASWIKTKLNRRQEFVVGGWLEGKETKALGSLVVGTWDESGSLTVAGSVASGMTSQDRALIEGSATMASVSPFTPAPTFDRSVHWLEPKVVVEVSFARWPGDGLLREPVFCGFRPDVDPTTVIREIPDR